MSLADAAGALLRPVNVPKGEPRRIGRLASFDGLMLEATGFSQPIGAGARVIAADGRAARAEVVGFRGPRTLLMGLDADAPHIAGARVEPDQQGGTAEVGLALLGRVVDALGQPLDGMGPIGATQRWPLAGLPGNPLERDRVTQPFDTGVRAVNALLTAGVGQRIAICAGSGVGKSVLMGQMIQGADADVIVVGLVGERSREVSDFMATKLKGAVRGRSVVVAVPADHPPMLRLRAAMRATAIAEWFRAQGKRVLLLLDSLTRVAHAQREIGLSLGEPPTMKGYPPSALGLIPRLIERAGADRKTGGSITALYTVLADGDDAEDPVVDTARAIVDGHIILSRRLSEQGVFPAIDVAKSLSRVMADIVDPDHAQAAAVYRRLWSVYEENRDLVLMGAYRTGSDPLVDLAVQRQPDLLAFLAQPPGERSDFAGSRAALIEYFGMSRLVARAARISRVRRVAHLAAVAAVAEAERHVAGLEASAERLGQLRTTLIADGGPSGASLASAHELALRLDGARTGLADATAAARARAAQRDRDRLDARRDQESAERLESRARDLAALEAERRGPTWRPRRIMAEEGA